MTNPAMVVSTDGTMLPTPLAPTTMPLMVEPGAIQDSELTPLPSTGASRDSVVVSRHQPKKLLHGRDQVKSSRDKHHLSSETSASQLQLVSTRVKLVTAGTSPLWPLLPKIPREWLPESPMLVFIQAQEFSDSLSGKRAVGLASTLMTDFQSSSGAMASTLGPLQDPNRVPGGLL